MSRFLYIFRGGGDNMLINTFWGLDNEYIIERRVGFLFYLREINNKPLNSGGERHRRRTVNVITSTENKNVPSPPHTVFLFSNYIYIYISYNAPWNIIVKTTDSKNKSLLRSRIMITPTHPPSVLFTHYENCCKRRQASS